MEIEAMTDIVFKVLGVQSREDCVSNALAYAFNASGPFQQAFLTHICGKEPSRYTSCQAFTRISAGAAGIPDIVLALWRGTRGELVIIENKLKAEEGADQTKRYASDEAIAALSRRLLPDRSIAEASFVFLTLFPDQQPLAADRYTVKRHADLRSMAAEIGDWGNDLAEQLMRTGWRFSIHSMTGSR